jgi:hypothetical protein
MVAAAAIAASCQPAKYPDTCSRAAYKALDVACVIAIREAKTDEGADQAQRWCVAAIDAQAAACGGGTP